MKTLNVGIVGYKFMGKAHSNAWMKAPLFFDLPVKPVMKVACGRHEEPLKEFAERWGVTVECEDPEVRDRVHRLTATGMEYEKTSEDFAYGIRSTPTMIINNRMVIGTLPYEQLKAIFQALDDEAERGGSGFIEGWEPTGD